jgi:hypothetical protein
MQPTYRHPLQRQFAAEVPPGGLGLPPQRRPRLTGQWGVSEDGQLTCRWTSQP